MLGLQRVLARLQINDLLGDPVTGERRDSCSIYIAAALNPSSPSYCPNLNLVQSVTASRVLIEGGTAVGVETLDTVSKGGPRVWRATREVIVSAGPFGSPKLLQLSGIGQPEVLAAAGVPVRCRPRMHGCQACFAIASACTS